MVTLYHNPRCSKSRATLALLTDRGYEPHIVRYLEAGLTAAALKKILRRLDCSALDLIRKGEALYQQLDIAKKALTEEQLIDLVVQHPLLLERPIVVNDDKAAIGRPPQNVLAIL